MNPITPTIPTPTKTKKLPNRFAASTAQRDAARRNRNLVLHDLHCLIALLASRWPAHVAPAHNAKSDTDDWRYVVCLHTPLGKRLWKISVEDRETLFAALPERDDDWEPETSEQRTAKLEELITLVKPLPI